MILISAHQEACTSFKYWCSSNCKHIISVNILLKFRIVLGYKAYALCPIQLYMAYYSETFRNFVSLSITNSHTVKSSQLKLSHAHRQETANWPTENILIPPQRSLHFIRYIHKWSNYAAWVTTAWNTSHQIYIEHLCYVAARKSLRFTFGKKKTQKLYGNLT